MAAKKKEMKQIVFFKKVRFDGSVRSGIDVDDETLLENYEPGTKPFDNAIAWYVDIRCGGKNLPSDAERAREWLLDNSTAIKAGLEELADHLQLGLDLDVRPNEYVLFRAPAGAKIAIASFAAHPRTAQDMAASVREVADHWEEALEKVEAVQVY